MANKTKARKMTAARKAAIAAYTKERDRIRRRVKALQEKGYTVSEEVKVPATASSLKELPTASIKKLTRESQYWTQWRIERRATKKIEVSGETAVITAEEHYEKSPRKLKKLKSKLSWEAAKKKLKAEEEEKKRKAQEPTTTDSRIKALEDELKELRRRAREEEEQRDREEAEKRRREEEEWQRKRREEDERQKRRGATDSSYARDFAQGSVILNAVQDKINSFQENFGWKTGEKMKRILDEQLAKYGRSKVIQNLANASEDIIEATEIALVYHEGTGQHSRAVMTFVQLLSGEIPTAKVAKEMEDAMEEDDLYNDYSNYELY